MPDTAPRRAAATAAGCAAGGRAPTRRWRGGIARRSARTARSVTQPPPSSAPRAGIPRLRGLPGAERRRRLDRGQSARVEGRSAHGHAQVWAHPQSGRTALFGLRPSVHPEDVTCTGLDLAPSRAEVAETPSAIVFFAGDRAYKLKKPVDLGFLDFRTRAARERTCRREVELNRRFSPDVYLGVADVHGPSGELCDHLVVMRRMPADRRLSALVREGAPVSAALRAVARRLATWHAAAPRGPDIAAEGTRDALRGRWAASFEQVRSFHGTTVGDAEVRRDRAAHRSLPRRTRGAVRPARPRGPGARRAGDLLADDIFCLDDGPRILDCLEFDDRLRWLDGLDDAAFLAMDLEELGATGPGRSFLGLASGALRRHLAGLAWPTTTSPTAPASEPKVATIKAIQDGDPVARRCREVLRAGGAPPRARTGTAGPCRWSPGYGEVLGRSRHRRPGDGVLLVPTRSAASSTWRWRAPSPGVDEGRYAPAAGRPSTTRCWTGLVRFSYGASGRAGCLVVRPSAATPRPGARPGRPPPISMSCCASRHRRSLNPASRPAGPRVRTIGGDGGGGSCDADEVRRLARGNGPTDRRTPSAPWSTRRSVTSGSALCPPPVRYGVSRTSRRNGASGPGTPTHGRAAPAGHLDRGQPDHVRLGSRRPRPKAVGGDDPVTMVPRASSFRSGVDENAPPGLVQGLEAVDLEGDGGGVREGRELGARVRTHDDVVTQLAA